jgi:hypothetical protein
MKSGEMKGEKKTTLVMGATPNPARYAYIAIHRLRSYGHPVIAFGKETGKVADVEIENEWDPDWQVDTITLYMNPMNQQPFLDKMIELKPKRVIFNPGTENPAFIRELKTYGIEAEIACTLVMLSIGNY